MKPTLTRHRYVDDPETPGTCLTCHASDPDQRNARHQLPDLTEQTSESRRRAGESTEDDE